MTSTPEPGFLSSTPSADQVAWWWQQLDADGAVLDRERAGFPTRSDAESWLGEAYLDLADDGVASVTLFEGDREVYGPMSLGPA